MVGLDGWLGWLACSRLAVFLLFSLPFDGLLVSGWPFSCFFLCRFGLAGSGSCLALALLPVGWLASTARSRPLRFFCLLGGLLDCFARWPCCDGSSSPPAGMASALVSTDSFFFLLFLDGASAGWFGATDVR